MPAESLASPGVAESSLERMLCAAPWFDGLTPEERERVRDDVQQRVATAGTFVARRGEEPHHWMGVIDGLLKMSNTSSEGKLATFAGLPNGAWFGEGTLLKNEARRYDLVALRTSRIAYLPRVTFDWLLGRSVPFNRFLLDQVNERLGQFIATVENDRLLDPDARVARCLGSLVHPTLYPGNGNALRISQAEIGNLAGVSRQRVNQALKRLEDDALLVVEYGGIRVVDLEGLRTAGA